MRVATWKLGFWLKRKQVQQNHWGWAEAVSEQKLFWICESKSIARYPFNAVACAYEGYFPQQMIKPMIIQDIMSNLNIIGM